MTENPQFIDDYAILDLHGCHNNILPDDGRSTPEKMIEANFEQGTIPAMTSHDSINAISTLLQLAQHHRRLAIPAIEHSYQIKLPQYPPIETIIDYHQTPQKGHSKATTMQSQGELQTHIGEVICYFQPHLLPKITKITNYLTQLRSKTNSKSRYNPLSLHNILEIYKTHLTSHQFDNDIVWNIPHPVSIDTTPFGKLLTRLQEGNVALFPPELLISHINQQINLIEIHNAAHPAFANDHATNLANTPTLSHLKPTASSDSHFKKGVGAAATLIKTTHHSLDGIFEALKDPGKPTILLSGLGTYSLQGWKPFWSWIRTVNLKGFPANLGQHLLRRILPDMPPTNARSVAEKLATEHNLNELGQIYGWIYLNQDLDKLFVHTPSGEQPL